VDTPVTFPNSPWEGKTGEKKVFIGRGEEGAACLVKGKGKKHSLKKKKEPFKHRRKEWLRTLFAKKDQAAINSKKTAIWPPISSGGKIKRESLGLTNYP